jgi:hypothetical protein
LALSLHSLFSVAVSIHENGGGAETVTKTRSSSQPFSAIADTTLEKFQAFGIYFQPRVSALKCCVFTGETQTQSNEDLGSCEEQEYLCVGCCFDRLNLGAVCLAVCSLRASCANDHWWSQQISMSITKPLLLRYSEGMMIIAQK